MNYDFKVLPELGWALGLAAVLFLFQLFVTFEPEAIEDWETWATAAAGGMARAVAAAGLSFVKSYIQSQ